METYDEIKADIEKELYEAIEALEHDDLITVRQCSARAQSGANAAWQAIRHNSPENVTK